MAQEEKKYLSESGLLKLVERIKAGFAKLTHSHTLSEITDYIVDSEIKSDSTNPVQNRVLKSALDEKVSITRTVNGKPLNADINLTADDVGATTVSAVTSALSTHNTNTEAHNDIRILINDITTRLNALANSTDVELDQMAELVTYIKTNRNLIEGITTDKVNVSDIINNLTTNVSNKPLSAAQGVELKLLIDALQESVEGKAENEHSHGISEITNLQGELDKKANAANVAYIDENDNETVTLSVNIEELASLIGGDV